MNPRTLYCSPSTKKVVTMIAATPVSEWLARRFGHRVACLVVAPSVRPGTVGTGRFGHLSLLRTTESMLGLSTSLASGAPSMRSAFHL